MTLGKLPSPSLALAVFFTTLLLSGCSKEPGDQGRVVTNPNSLQAETERIQNDPNMPPQAKAAALKSLRESKSKGEQTQRLSTP